MSDTMTIRCNNIPRDILSWHDLTAKERADFDYLDTEDEQYSAQFVRYRGACYDLGEFMCIDRTIAPHCQRPGWESFDGYHSDTFFSATLVRLVDDGERVIMARCYS